MARDSNSADIYVQARLRAHAEEPWRRAWNATRIYDRAHELLLDEALALEDGKNTICYKLANSVRRSDATDRGQWIFVKMVLPRADPKWQSKEEHLYFRAPGGLRLAWAAAHHLLLGERMFVEALVRSMLRKMGALEGEHCREHGVGIAPGIMAIKERSELDGAAADSQAAKARRPPL